MSARSQTGGLGARCSGQAVKGIWKGCGEHPSSPALVELQGCDQAFLLITNRQNMSCALSGPSTPHCGLHQEAIFKGQVVCQRDICAKLGGPCQAPSFAPPSLSLQEATHHS